MAIGPGKFDDLCTDVREKAKAIGAIVIILNGEKGSGFSVQGPLDVQRQLPAVLRYLADSIEKDLREK